MNKAHRNSSGFFLPAWIALRYMRSKKSERSVSFFSAVSFIGLALGVASIIVVMSVMNGFESEMHKRILGMLPHVSVENKKASDTVLSIANWVDYTQALESDAAFSEQIDNISPFVHKEALISHQGAVKPVRLVGVDPLVAEKHSALNHYMLTAPLSELNANERNIILGSDIGRELGLIAGDKLTLMLPTVEGSRLSARYFNFELAGFFDVGSDADALLGYINLQHASELKYRNGEDGVHVIDGLQIQLKDVYAVESLAPEFRKFFAGQFEIHTWQETYGQLFQTVKLEKIMTATTLLLIVLVAAFNTVSSLSLMVTEKHSSLAVLRTMGLRKNDLVWIFFIQGFLISCAGILAGLLIGVFVALELERIIGFINELEIIWLAPLKAELLLSDVVYLSCAALFISVISASLPAMRASKIQGADAVRYH